MSDVRQWLDTLGLGRYADGFDDSECEAVDLVAPLVSGFTEGVDTADLEKADAPLAELS